MGNASSRRNLQQQIDGLRAEIAVERRLHALETAVSRLTLCPADAAASQPSQPSAEDVARIFEQVRALAAAAGVPKNKPPPPPCPKLRHGYDEPTDLSGCSVSAAATAEAEAAAAATAWAAGPYEGFNVPRHARQRMLESQGLPHTTGPQPYDPLFDTAEELPRDASLPPRGIPAGLPVPKDAGACTGKSKTLEFLPRFIKKSCLLFLTHIY